MHTSVMMAVNSPTAVHRDHGGGVPAYRPFNVSYADMHQSDRPLQSSIHIVANTVDDVKERNKRDKKWSIGKLFRRKKKEDESSSSESDEGISTKSNSKRKSKKKKRSQATLGNFDHIVVSRDNRRAQSLMKQKSRDFVDEGVLSDPSAGFIAYRGRNTREHFGTSKESLNVRDDSTNKLSNTSLEGSGRRTRKGRLKARVEALRNSMRKDSSSDEESQKSSASSSMIRFRSDDSLMHHSRDSSLSKRSRSARNERYIKRLSRDEENQLNKEAELLQQGYTKAEVELLTRTPTSQSSGYGTCKRDSQATSAKSENVYINEFPRRPMKSESVSSFPSTQSYSSSVNYNARVNKDCINYAIKYPNSNIIREPVYANNNTDRLLSEKQCVNYNDEVMCIKFPLGNVTNMTRDQKSPPVPPPRDLNRKVATPVHMSYENSHLKNDRNAINRAAYGVVNNDFDKIMRRSQERSVNPTINGLRRPLSNSEDHIAMQDNEHILNSLNRKLDQPRRPASVSAEPNHYNFYVNSSWKRQPDPTAVVKPEPVPLKQDFLYFADQSPRSRKPISIKSSQNNYDKQYLSDSQASLGCSEHIQRRPRNASEFWRKIDNAECQRKRQNIYANTASTVDQDCGSPQVIHKIKPVVNQLQHINNTSTHRNRIPDASGKNNVCENGTGLTLHSTPRDTVDGSKMWKATTEYKRSLTTELPKVISPTKAHIRHKSDTQVCNPYQVLSDEDRAVERRKSTNLDDALNELEAIYNSLGLGDEDLLDRAERRELMMPRFSERFNDWNGNDEVQLRSQPTTPLKRNSIQRRSTLPDKLQDDMAFRRLNSKEKPSYKDTHSQISYMLASPVFVPYASDDDRHLERENHEPDIVHDDVVYRNIKQANNHLKSMDPQPPFGIPLGPISPAPQSDYLHATPENKTRSRFIPRRSPDLVSDDMAYRTLRKDNRHSSLFNGDDFDGYVNNNHNQSELTSTNDSTANIKKKRAVRSLSANIFTMIQKEIDDALNMSKLATLQKTQSNSDVNNILKKRCGPNDGTPDVGPRNKVKHRHNTVNIFVSNHHPSSLHFAKDDTFVDHDDKYLAKPPHYDKSKSSSPSSKSPQPVKKGTKDDFQQVLTMLAQEAMDTSNKLGVALAELDKSKYNNYQFDKKIEPRESLSDTRAMFMNSLKSSSGNTFPEVKHVKVHSEIVQGPDEERAATRMREENSKARKTEDSLMEISNQLHKVEDKLKHSYEKELNLEDESHKLSEYIARAEDKIKAQELTVVMPESKHIPKVKKLVIKDDVVKAKNAYPGENKVHELTRSLGDNLEICSSKPSVDAKVNELSEMTSFSDLKEGISDLIAGISQVNDKLFHSSNFNDDKEAKHRDSINISVYEGDLEINKDNLEATEYNSSEELATIFKFEPKANTSNAPANEPSEPQAQKSEEIRSVLNSPRLVHSINQHLRRLSTDSNESNPPSQSNSRPSNTEVPWRTKRHISSSQHEPQVGDRTEHRGKARSWYRDPGTLMLACTYTLVCSQQLAELDWLTLLGLLLAMISIIAMLLI